MESVRGDIRAFIGTELGRDVQAVSDSESLLESGILDSMGVMALVSFIEERFSIAVADDEMLPENFDTIDAIDAFVRRQRGSA